MIEDKELCDLFKAESEEHLQSLDVGLLRLEASPKDKATLEQVFRDAHSLKGTARMLGVGTVEAIGHHFEDALGAAARGQAVLSSDTIDRLYRGLDAIRKLVHEAVTGEASGVDVARVLAQLSGEAPAGSTAKAQPATEQPVQETAEPAECTAPDVPVDATLEMAPFNGTTLQPQEPLHKPALSPPFPLPTGTTIPAHTEAANGATAPAEARPIDTPEEVLPAAEVVSAVEVPPVADDAAVPAPQSEFKIQTIRVEPARLDSLMTMAGELTVTTNRVTRGLDDFKAITDLWAEWSKDAQRNRSLLAEMERHALNGATNTVKQLAAFHEREQGRLDQIGVLLGHLRRTTYEDVTRLNFVADELEEAIRKVRLLPLSTIFNLFPRMVRDLARTQQKEVQIIIEGGETAADKRILEELKDPLMHMVRNSIDHGIEPPAERVRQGKPRQATLRLRAQQTSTNVIIEISDDGRGLNLEAIKSTALRRHVAREEELSAMSPAQIESLIFSPGFSTSPLVTDVSGRGVGLDVVRANVENLRGTIEIESQPGVGCTFRVQLPVTLATTRVLLVEADDRTYALPVEFVSGMTMVSQQEIFSIEGRETYRLEGQPVSIARLANLLDIRETIVTLRSKRKSESRQYTVGGSGIAPEQLANKQLPCIFLSLGGQHLGLLVDTLIDEQEIMLKPLGALLKRVRNVSGTTILGTGEVCVVLNPHDLIKTVQKSQARTAPPASALTEPGTESPSAIRKTILLVEDSITTRTQEKRILESAGYEVVTAVDGVDGYHKLRTRDFDAVVSDIEMPNMNGLSLTEKIRQDDKYKELPIILVTSLASEEDRRRGVEVGANAYITKSAFEQKALLDTLGRLA